ncbi:MAG: methyltransferase domain-containing protein [Solirubrobacterales bacterium]|nr:methyltransferase domain-containing protein [Solirubrobacterales bacterium]
MAGVEGYRGARMAIGRRKALLYRRILSDRGWSLRDETTLLDLGCGDGALVWAFREMGVDAQGCDLELGSSAPHLRQIQPRPYQLPFASRSFDVVVSLAVMEHVQNWTETIDEVARVLKPDGVTLHVFPARFRPLEAHVHVPLAGVLQHAWWLKLWARAGVRNRFQRHMASADVVLDNEVYLRDQTAYPTRRQVATAFARCFAEVRFCDREMICHASDRVRSLPTPVRRCLGAIAPLYGTFGHRSLLAFGPRDPGRSTERLTGTRFAGFMRIADDGRSRASPGLG